MDTAAVIARKPEWVLVDELAHTNVPGTVHEKRWQSVEEILAAGINVISTVNVQHFESLNDTDLPDHHRARARDAARLGPRPGRRGRARRPDGRRADQPAEPRRRLRPRQDPRRPQQLLPARQPRGAARARPAQDRRRGRREARGLHRRRTRSRRPGRPRTAWSCASRPGRSPRSSCAAATVWPSACRASFWVVHVHTPGESLGRHHDELDELFELARNLGGSVVELSGDSEAEAILDVRPRARGPPSS